MQANVFFKEAHPALPPPRDAVAKRRRITAQAFIRVLCLALALFVLSLCAYQKLNEVFEEGIAVHLQKVLFSQSGEPLGEKVIAVAFGDLDYAPSKNEVDEISLPKIFYVPKEDLVKKAREQKLQKEAMTEELYSFDLSEVPNGFYPIVPIDSSTKVHLALKNDTRFSPDMEKIANAAENLSPASITGEPLVLIVHTHGTEAFSSEVPYYSDTFNHPRSENVSENAVAVGKVLCDELNKKGIPTLHCETMHDKDSYISAYDRSAESIKHYLEKYPSIKYVFDVHRDSLIRSDLTKLRPVTLRKNSPCAQIMMIVGTSEKGAGEYAWEENLVLAAAVQGELIKDTENVARSIYLRGASYNQQYANYGLLLEIGSCGNTLAEAKEAARAFADAFEKVIKK